MGEVNALRLGAPLGIAAWMIACGAAGNSGNTASPLTAIPTTPAQEPSATAKKDAREPRWDLHPPGGAHARAKLDLDSGRSVYVTDGGARWLVRTVDGTHVATSAPTLLPEALATVTPATSGMGSAGMLWFVGVSGNVYPARDALSDAEEPRRPPFPLHSVTAGHAAILGLAESGRMLRTVYGGASWDEVKIDGAPAKVIEAALDREGHGLAMLGANDLRVSTDDGATWKPLAVTGAMHVLVATDGALYVQRAKEAMATLRDGALIAADAAPQRVFVLPQAGDGRARVSALRRGAAAFEGSRLVSVERDARGAQIMSETIGEAVQTERAADLDACAQAWPAIAGNTLVVACDARNANQGGDAWIPLRVLSREGAGPFHEEAQLGSAPGEKHVWVSSRGAIFITGACDKPDARGKCLPPDALAKPAGATAFVRPRTEPVRKNASYVVWYAAYSVNGDRLYALADDVNNVHGRTILLVSKDDGVTFKERFLPAIPAPGGHTLRPGHAGGLFPGSDGVLRIATRAGTGAQATWLVYETKDDANSFDVRVSHLEAPRAMELGEHRGFAWDPHGAGWETLDAGKTWVPLPAPADGVPLAEENAPAVVDMEQEIGAVSRKLACGDRGCFVGDVATRIGWTSR